jgi:DNA-binding transcriptional MocR family regulator
MISFARGVPASECLPVDELADCARAAIERDGPVVLSYGSPGGYGPLREWIGERHGVEPGRVFVTSGALQGLSLLFEHYAPMARFLVEAPTYDRALKIAARETARVSTIPQDGDGLDVDALVAELERDSGPAFLYLLPTFQNPSGRTLATDRRRAIAELTERYDLTVLEDDPYGRVRYSGRPEPLVFDLAGGPAGTGRVLYASSFSKIVAPGARVGYFVLPAALTAELEAHAANVFLSPPFVAQATVFEFLRRGNLDANIARVCELLGARRDAMLEALDEHFPETVTWSRPEGGYFLWVDFPPGVDTRELLGRAEAAGVTFVKGSDFYPNGGGESSARLAFSYPSPAEIRTGVKAIGSLLRRSGVV